MVKNYLTAKQVEGILQTVREKQDYIGKIEREVTRANGGDRQEKQHNSW